VGGDPELLDELVATRGEESGGTMDAVRGAVESGDLGEVERSSHRLDGAVLASGARSVADPAAELERMGREGSLDKGSAGPIAMPEEAVRELTDAPAEAAGTYP